MLESRLRSRPVDPRDPTVAREERRLWAVVLADAIGCAQRTRPTDGEGYDDFIVERNAAIKWLADDSDRLFGFVWCCHVVGIEPAFARRALAKGECIAVAPSGQRRHFIVVRGGKDDSEARTALRVHRPPLAQAM